MSAFNPVHAESTRRRQRASFLDEVLSFTVDRDEHLHGLKPDEDDLAELAAEILIYFDEVEAIRYDREDQSFMALSEEY